MDERRLLTAVALSLLVLMGYSYLFPPKRPSPAPSAGPSAAAPGPQVMPEPAEKDRARESTTTAVSAPAKDVLVRREDERERRIEVRTPSAEIAFTNRGARVVSWKIAQVRNGERRLEEMVRAAPGGAKPFDIETGDAALDETVRTGLFLASSTERGSGGWP